MNSLKIALLALAGVLLIGFAISLITADQLSRRLQAVQHEFYLTDNLLQRVSSERDTLADINSFLMAKEYSLNEFIQRADSLQARLHENDLRNNYYGHYLLIDTGQNRFHLRRSFGNGEDILVRSGYCGTGKGWTSNDSGKVWDFSTPRGLRYVVKTGENPYWYRPDWYWQEMNLTPPTPDEYVVIPDTLSWDDQIVYYRDSLSAEERIWVQKVPGVLGEYKIDLGGGILIHYGVGRGRNISHGCIRMSNADLEALYRALPVGAPVIIY
ncbi:MAG: L,D-transpeptidase [Candidatus Fermentibacteraceae bacterium]|nr:L,D-transpeptidase [Candidatus Fermentibacteraceae bacterium]